MVLKASLRTRTRINITAHNTMQWNHETEVRIEWIFHVFYVTIVEVWFVYFHSEILIVAKHLSPDISRTSSEMSKGHFSSSTKMSRHFGTRAKVCLRHFGTSIMCPMNEESGIAFVLHHTSFIYSNITKYCGNTAESLLATQLFAMIKGPEGPLTKPPKKPTEFLYNL